MKASILQGDVPATSQIMSGELWMALPPSLKRLSELSLSSVTSQILLRPLSSYRLVKQSTIDFAQVAIQRDDFINNNDMFNRLLAQDHIALVPLMRNRQPDGRLIVSIPSI